jgi:transcriptional regulator with XRE-family HTH domain
MKKRKEIILIGQRIRKLRKERGYAQEAFANQINIGRAFYGRIERGEMAPGSLILIKVAKALGVEVGELFPSLQTLREINVDDD